MRGWDVELTVSKSLDGIKVNQRYSVATPDGRYIVVKGRLWRQGNPHLDDREREKLVEELMAARRSIRSTDGNRDSLLQARAKVHQAKVALGERGPVWWTDGAPDFTRRLARNTPYAEWYREAPAMLEPKQSEDDD